MLKYIFSSLLVIIGMTAEAQVKDMQKDSLRRIQKPTGIRVGTDLIVLGKNFFDSPLAGWELNADMDFGRYYLAVDYGYAQRNDKVDNGIYKNDGRYFRAGVDINFLLKDPDKNMFFVGFRYARASFNENLTYEINTDGFGTITNTVANTGASAGWAEMTTGLRVKIWKYVWLGYTARMKFLPAVKNNSGFETYDVPGFGRISKGLYWGFNYQLFLKIPFKKENRKMN